MIQNILFNTRKLDENQMGSLANRFARDLLIWVVEIHYKGDHYGLSRVKNSHCISPLYLTNEIQRLFAR